LEQAGFTQQYYIAAKSAPTEEHTRVLKYAEMFCVFGRSGDVQTLGLGEQGLFFQGTRYLSELVLYLWNARPLLLSSNVDSSNLLFTADLANLDVLHEDVVAIPRGTIHIERSRFLSHNICHERLEISNYGLTRLEIPLQVSFEADFADIFEVRGMERPHRGSRDADVIHASSCTLSYEGLDGKLRRTRIACKPQPRTISSGAVCFDISVGPGGSASVELAISCEPAVGQHLQSYSHALSSARQEVESFAADLPVISSSNSRFTDWMARSLADLQMMTLGNPEQNYPYAGAPWFSTVFGRDGIICALQTLWFCPRIARGVLEYLSATQAQECYAATDAEPGKILHEMRTGEMAALGEVPFGRYYGSVDATPLFVFLAGEYFERTRDLELMRKLWPNIERALQWINDWGDVDGDGFVEYARQSRNGLVQQGWKDSNDSVFHQDGSLAIGPIALCEVQGYVYAAKLAAARICQALGDSQTCSTLTAEAETLLANFDQAFWCDQLSTYALALDGKKQQCRIRTSNAGHCLFTGIARPDRAARVAGTLLGADSFSGWGIRTVASGQARYNPLSYHNGSVWPHDNSLIASGLSKYHLKHMAGRILLSQLDVSNHVDLRRLPELFCGLSRRAGDGPTLYPVACSPQAWAAGSALLLLQACLGLSLDGTNRIVFDQPYLPNGIPQVWIKNLHTGSAVVELFLEKHTDEVRVEVLEQQDKVEVAMV
jgi:glycogen debranching enzyme